MGIILYILGMAWIGNLIAWKLEFKAWLWIKENYLTMRLFNCSTCFSFWLSFPLNIIFTNDIFLSLIISSCISFAAAMMENNLCRFDD